MDRDIGFDGRMETTRWSAPLRRFVLTLLLLASICEASTAWAAGKVNFDLRSDEFPNAILEFYHQSKISVLFSANDTLNKIRTQPVHGELEPREALKQMLLGTGLTFDFDTDHSVVIKQQQAVSEAPASERIAPARTLEPSVHHPAAADTVVPRQTSLDEVLITGSLIRTAVDVQAPIQTLTYSDISRAPYPTVQDTLYQLPITSLNAPREDLGINNNYNFGAGVNLRGLGVAATLVLVNGHRQPLSGSSGDFVDVSNIPAAAVDRIEILPDGASATYGSDAVAGVVNIILKNDFQGAKTELRYGGAPGGRDEIRVSQLLGTHWDSGRAMFVYEYADGTDLAASTRGYAANADKRRPYGGADYRSYFSDPGNILDFNTLLPIYGVAAGLNGTPLTAAGRSSTINLENQFAQYQIFPQRTSHSLYVTFAQQLGNSVELFAEGRFTRRGTYVKQFPDTETLYVPASNPYNALGTDALEAYSFGNSLGPVTFGGETRNYVATAGARFDIGAGWRGTVSESYGREILFSDGYNEVDLDKLPIAIDNGTFNPFGANSTTVLAAISRVHVVHAVSGIETTNIVFDGPLFRSPGGPAKLAVGLERREESLDHTVGSIVDPDVVGDARYSRHVGSAFAELLVPLLGDEANPHISPRLDLDIAGRYDDYSDFGHTTNPEFKLRFTPADWLKLRASWGRSYRAPKLDDLYDTSNNASGELVLPDLASPTGRSTVLAIQGNNPNLKQETATTWTAGLDVVPVVDPGLKLSLTYYAIDYEGQIAAPDVANPYDILLQGNEWAAAITRNPTPAQVAAVCGSPDYFQPRQQCLASSPAAIVDYRLANLASTKVAGIDVDLHQTLVAGLGRFDLGFNGSYAFHFDQAVVDTLSGVDILNTYGNPLKFRFRASAGWSQHRQDDSGFGVDMAVNYANGYTNPGSTSLPHIDSLTTVDLSLRYRAPVNRAAWSGLELILNAVNVFNQSPPFADTAYGYDTANFQGLGRTLSVSLRKKW